MEIVAAILGVGVTVISAVIIDGVKTRVRIGIIDDRVSSLRDWQARHEQWHDDHPHHIHRTR
jgi:uncharacterized membrane protein